MSDTLGTTADLIRELEKEAKSFAAVALVIGFEKHTEFIWSKDDNKLEKLNALVKGGGEPVGLIGFVADQGIATIYTRPLAEYAGESWMKSYLDHLVETAGRLAVESGLAQSFRRAETGGWIH